MATEKWKTEDPRFIQCGDCDFMIINHPTFQKYLDDHRYYFHLGNPTPRERAKIEKAVDDAWERNSY